MEDLEQQLRETADLLAELGAAQHAKVHHANVLQIIELTPGTAEAMKKAGGRKTKFPLPYEAEYREARQQLHKAQRRLDATEKKIDAAQRPEDALRQRTPGIFEHAFLDYQRKMSLQKAAFHNEALCGNDIHSVFQPGSIAGFTNQMRPRIQTVCFATGDADKPVTFGVAGAGSHREADDTKMLWEAFSAAKTIYSRVEPLCDHQREQYRNKMIPRLATLHAAAFPAKVPTPKLHAICFHTPDQADACGTIGQFCEAVIEAAHVADNEYRRGFAAVTDLQMNLKLRYRAYCHAANATVASLKAVNQKKAAAKRKRRNHGSRRAKHAFM